MLLVDSFPSMKYSVPKLQEKKNLSDKKFAS